MEQEDSDVAVVGNNLTVSPGTNVLVSALINDGKPRKLVLKLLDEHTVILSRQMIAELADVFAR